MLRGVGRALESVVTPCISLALLTAVPHSIAATATKAEIDTTTVVATIVADGVAGGGAADRTRRETNDGWLGWEWSSLTGVVSELTIFEVLAGQRVNSLTMTHALFTTEANSFFFFNVNGLGHKYF